MDTSAKQKQRPSRQARRKATAAIRSSTFVIAKPCKRLWQSVSPLRKLRILSRLSLLRCPKVVIRLEREQLLTAAPAVARFFLHRSESNVTQNDIPFSRCNTIRQADKLSLTCHCEHRKVRGNPFPFLRILRILSRLSLLRCPKVVIRLEREQLLTAAPAVARFFLHRSESNVTQNDKE